MLDESFYQKADEIIANHTKEERSPDPYHSGYSGRVPLSSARTAYLCRQRNRHHRRPRLQCCELL